MTITCEQFRDLWMRDETGRSLEPSEAEAMREHYAECLQDCQHWVLPSMTERSCIRHLERWLRHTSGSLPTKLDRSDPAFQRWTAEAKRYHPGWTTGHLADVLFIGTDPLVNSRVRSDAIDAVPQGLSLLALLMLELYDEVCAHNDLTMPESVREALKRTREFGGDL